MIEFCASIENENAYGVQFHPEMCGEAGLKVLKNFIEM
jgi:imidazoleglycerol phosphate synthase glutamine amidotransferase subunit HisH